MPSLRSRLAKDFPELTFTKDASFYWSPKNQTVYYDPKDRSHAANWKLLHETAHGLLGHKIYQTDFELLKLETAAWQRATRLAGEYSIVIDENHIEDSLDSYRDWLHARSTCPTCRANGLMTSKNVYECLNCSSNWRVSGSRFCRAYRLSISNQK